MIFVIVVTSVAILTSHFLSEQFRGIGFIIGAALMALFTFIYVLNRRGFTRIGSIIFLVSVWALFPILVLMSNGVHDPLLAGHIVVILLAGILIGKRAALWAGSFSVIALVLVAILTNAGWVHDLLRLNLVTQTIIYAAIFIGSAILIALLIQDTSDHLLAWGEAINDLAKEIQAREQIEEQLRHEVFHDSLTRLPNRVLFHDRLEQSILRFRRNASLQFAVLFLDIDRFKFVNDTMGHSCGDELLIIVANRLKKCIREVDTVARMGGDEFALILEEITGNQEVDAVLDRIHAELKSFIVLKEKEIYVSASIGIVLANKDYLFPEDYLRDADLAMYNAKQEGGGSSSMFSSRLRQETDLRAKLEEDLRHAIEAEQFHLNYQPIYDVCSRKIVACEALLRWRHPQLGMVSPTTFIPVAEETGLIIPIGEWVLESACRQAVKWTQMLDYREDLRISVNVSAKQLVESGFKDFVKEILEKTKLPPENLSLEVTESAIVSDVRIATSVLESLQQIGISIHMDDFGTGYSALGQVGNYPLDHLKIDRSFIQKMNAGRHDAGLVRTIIAMAKEFELRVIAEGVETNEQIELLAQLGCDQAQGFLLSRPLEARDVTQLLAETNVIIPGDEVSSYQNGRYEATTKERQNH